MHTSEKVELKKLYLILLDAVHTANRIEKSGTPSETYARMLGTYEAAVDWVLSDMEELLKGEK